MTEAGIKKSERKAWVGIRAMDAMVRGGLWAAFSDAERAVAGVYAAVADNDTGEFSYGVATIAEMAGLGTRAVQKANASLVARGVISRESDGGRSGTDAAVTRLLVVKVEERAHRGAPVAGGDGAHGDAPTGARGAGGGAHPDAPGGRTGVQGTGAPGCARRAHRGAPKLSKRELTKKLTKEGSAPAVAVPFPGVLNTLAFQKAWAEWEAYRTRRKKKLDPETARRQLAHLATHLGHDNAIKRLDAAMTNGWTGCTFPEDADRSKKNGNGTNRKSGEFADDIDFDAIVVGGSNPAA